MNGTIRFVCDHGNGVKVGVELSAESSCSEVVDAFRTFLLACEFHPKTVATELGDECS